MAAASGRSKGHSMGGGAWSWIASLNAVFLPLTGCDMHGIRGSMPEIVSVRESNLSNNGKMSQSWTLGVHCGASQSSAED